MTAVSQKLKSASNQSQRTPKKQQQTQTSEAASPKPKLPAVKSKRRVSLDNKRNLHSFLDHCRQIFSVTDRRVTTANWPTTLYRLSHQSLHIWTASFAMNPGSHSSTKQQTEASERVRVEASNQDELSTPKGITIEILTANESTEEKRRQEEEERLHIKDRIPVIEIEKPLTPPQRRRQLLSKTPKGSQNGLSASGERYRAGCGDSVTVKTTSTISTTPTFYSDVSSLTNSRSGTTISSAVESKFSRSSSASGSDRIVVDRLPSSDRSKKMNVDRLNSRAGHHPEPIMEVAPVQQTTDSGHSKDSDKERKIERRLERHVLEEKKLQGEARLRAKELNAKILRANSFGRSDKSILSDPGRRSSRSLSSTGSSGQTTASDPSTIVGSRRRAPPVLPQPHPAAGPSQNQVRPQLHRRESNGNAPSGTNNNNNTNSESRAVAAKNAQLDAEARAILKSIKLSQNATATKVANLNGQELPHLMDHHLMISSDPSSKERAQRRKSSKDGSSGATKAPSKQSSASALQSPLDEARHGVEASKGVKFDKTATVIPIEASNSSRRPSASRILHPSDPRAGVRRSPPSTAASSSARSIKSRPLDRGEAQRYDPSFRHGRTMQETPEQREWRREGLRLQKAQKHEAAHQQQPQQAAHPQSLSRRSLFGNGKRTEEAATQAALAERAKQKIAAANAAFDVMDKKV